MTVVKKNRNVTIIDQINMCVDKIDMEIHGVNAPSPPLARGKFKSLELI